jgi:uncharacterized lipoprotein YajG
MRLSLIPCLVCVLCTGCTMFTRTIYVPEGQTVRLRQDIKNAKVWVKEKDGRTAEGRLTLKEGWFCLYMPSWDTK